jgi:hypothetical protein
MGIHTPPNLLALPLIDLTKLAHAYLAEFLRIQPAVHCGGAQ